MFSRLLPVVSTEAGVVFFGDTLLPSPSVILHSFVLLMDLGFPPALYWRNRLLLKVLVSISVDINCLILIPETLTEIACFTDNPDLTMGLC